MQKISAEECEVRVFFVILFSFSGFTKSGILYLKLIMQRECDYDEFRRFATDGREKYCLSAKQSEIQAF